MDRSLIKGLVIGGLAVTAVSAGAGYTLLEREPKYAEVLSVTPVTKTVSVPRTECWNESVVDSAPTRDPDQVTGTVIGALAGGLLGNQVGGGSGKAAATVAGAAAGGYAGNKIQERMQDKNTQQGTQRRCKTEYYAESRPDGFDVRYKLRDEIGLVRMDHHPGERIPVQDGELVLTQVVDPDEQSTASAAGRDD